uniref:Uncharacterized protein n=1 Tax=Anguilla anguilla TaxID=7936 RepID=A0A0E9XDB5_ANGAN
MNHWCIEHQACKSAGCTLDGGLNDIQYLDGLNCPVSFKAVLVKYCLSLSQLSPYTNPLPCNAIGSVPSCGNFLFRGPISICNPL